MTNVRKLNQDDVLPDENLSPSAFDRSEVEIEEEQSAAPKKKSTLMPLIGGIAVALAIMGFFGWKIAAPYFADRGGSNGDAFTPIAAAPKPFEPTPNTVPTSEHATDQGVGAASVNLPPIPMPQNAAPGIPSPQISAAAGQPQPLGLATPAPSVPAGKLVTEQALAPAKPASPTADEIAQINKRIDGLGATLESLKGEVAKLQQLQAKPAPSKLVVVTSKPKPPVAQKPKPAPVAVVPKPKDAVRVEKIEKSVAVKPQDIPAVGMQLQAVLQDRAWFKTSTGETITVSPGEDLSGVGIVQQIDAESGRVVFTNGKVYR